MTFHANPSLPVAARNILGAALGLALLAASIGCSSEAAPAAGAPPAPDVSVAVVLNKQVRQWDEFTGRVAAVETVELRPRVTGYVEKVVFEEGQQVAKGELLFVIDQRSYRTQLDRAQANLERARSEARLARTQDVRARNLLDAQAISREEFDTREAATAQGNASVRAAEAEVAGARLDLQFTEVRSPISGRAGRALVTTGNLAQADASHLTTVVSLDPVHVYFETDEQTFLRYNESTRRGGRDASSNAVRVGLADESGYTHVGVVDFVDNQVDASTGTIRARAVIANPEHLFTPGLFARVQLEGDTQTGALLIDDKAVLTDQDRKYVYVLGPKNAAIRKDVVLGRMVDGLRVVASGLTPSDKVIVHGVQKVFFPGMPVSPTLIAMGEAAPVPKAPAAAGGK